MQALQWKASLFLLVLFVTISHPGETHAVPPIGPGEILEAEYVLTQQGKDVGWEKASWREDGESGGWLLGSEGEFLLGAIMLSFDQNTRYGADGAPTLYEMRVVVGSDSQIVRVSATADSVHMEVLARGRWNDRSLARPEHFAVLDNLLTSQTQTVLWNLDGEGTTVLHAVVPQRMLVLPATVGRRGEFTPEGSTTPDRGQPVPVGVPADDVALVMGPVSVDMAVAKDNKWLLQAAVPSQGLRFELRKLSRRTAQGSANPVILYESAGPAPPPEPQGFKEEEIPFESDGLTFTGTLCLPDAPGPHPVVLLLQGSGPNDRDETIGPNAPFRDIAHGLAKRGVGSFRYDKRTYLHPEEVDPRSVTLDEEMIRDAEVALQRLAVTDNVRSDALFLLGHSLGGTAALLVRPPAQQIRGVVLMATMGRPFLEVLQSQIEYLADLGRSSGRMTPEEEAKTEETLKKLDDLRAGTLPADELVLGMPSSYIEDLDRRDIVAGARALGAAVLILQGEKDYQVTPEDARLLEARLREAGVGDVTMRLFPDLGHLFIPVEGMPGPEHYSVAGSVDPKVLDLVAGWILERVP